jgi:hypothetical protein
MLILGLDSYALLSVTFFSPGLTTHLSMPWHFALPAAACRWHERCTISPDEVPSHWAQECPGESFGYKWLIGKTLD